MVTGSRSNSWTTAGQMLVNFGARRGSGDPAPHVEPASTLVLADVGNLSVVLFDKTRQMERPQLSMFGWLQPTPPSTRLATDQRQPSYRSV